MDPNIVDLETAALVLQTAEKEVEEALRSLNGDPVDDVTLALLQWRAEIRQQMRIQQDLRAATEISTQRQEVGVLRECIACSGSYPECDTIRNGCSHIYCQGCVIRLLQNSLAQAIEEQTLPFYHRKYYYPVKIGQVFNDRYRIIAKLGYGAYSTVWLARDERANEYTSLKVSVRIDNNNAKPSPVLNEVNMLKRLNQFAGKDHPGLDFTRLARDMFETESLAGRHYCIAYKPQGNSVRTLQEAFSNAMIPNALVKSLIHRLFFSVNWLHAICGVAHTDISPQNVLMEIDDDTILRDIEDQESQDPSLPITSTIDGSMPIVVYKSRPITMLAVSGHPILTDYGQMRLVEGCVNQDWWMPDLYRAPEVLLHLPWGFPVDLWSIGVMTLELLEGKNLFDPIDRVQGQYVLPLALAQYIGYLGPPPMNIIQNSPLLSTYFDAQGNWVSEPSIPKTSLENFVTTIPLGEEKDQFLRFIRKILTWDPEVIATANEIIPDEWLMRPL